MNRIKINLSFNKGFSWFINDAIHFKGYFYIDAVFYEKENAVNFLSQIQDLKSILKNLNGVFTILKQENNELFIVSDITRSFPLFFTFTNKIWFISDDINLVKDELTSDNLNCLSEIEFKASNHVHGSKTLLENVFQIQSSEYILFANNKIKERDFYFSYSILQESSSAYKDVKAATILAFESSFKRLLKSIEKRTVIIPLSAGFDSRLIAVMLKKFDYKNVICYTYGRKDSFEIKNSKKTAKALNFKWHFIEYKSHLIDEFLESEDFKNYTHFAGKLSSMPNLQEYFAVKFLKENDLIPEDSIFIPGYAGDILGGSEYLNTIPKDLKTKEIAREIVQKKMTNYSLSKNEEQQMEVEINKNLYLFDTHFKDKIPSTVFDDYNLKERIAKYIFNSAYFYTYFGYEFRFPFWDYDLLNLFKKVPVKYKQGKKLFNEVLINEYFKPHQVYFENESIPLDKNKSNQKIKNTIKPFFPTFIKEKKLEKNDWNNYKPITDQMLEVIQSKGLKINRKYNDYNEIITQWYLFLVKNKLN